MTPILIITRPQTAGASFARAVIEQFGRSVPVIQSPAFDIAFLDIDLPPFDQLIFTSQNGISAAARLGLPRGQLAWCVGDKTAEAARNAGFDSRSAHGDAAALVDLITDAHPDGHLLHLAGEHTRGEVAETLESRGITCEARTVYRQIPRLPSAELTAALMGSAPLVSPVFSPRSAAPLDLTGRAAPLHGVAISEAVAVALSQLGANSVTTAEKPDEPAMIAATVEVLTRLSGAG